MMPLNPEFWTQLWGNALSGLVAWLPRLLGALLLLVLGWIIARIVQFLLDNLLRRLKVDSLARRAGITRFLADAGMEASTSTMIARLVYWLVLLVFVLASAESLGLAGVADTLDSLVSYLPSVLAAALILLLGGVIARIAGDTVGALSSQAGVSAGLVLGQGVRYIIIAFAVILALDQLGIETALLTIAAAAIIVSIALALALAFGIGSREIARNIMAGFHAREEFKPGHRLQIAGRSGRVVNVGSIKTTLKNEEGLISIPNSTLTEGEVTLLSEEEQAE
jgi:small-conductance mechanosensitive channel